MSLPPEDNADDQAPHPAPGGNSGANSAVKASRRYHIQREGPGGCIARDQELDRDVSVRMAPAGDAATALEREARFTARLDHAGIPPVHDIVHADGGVLVVGRSLEGITLAEAIDQARDGLPPPELATVTAVIGMMAKVCDALAAAHARRVVHRSLGTGNIVLGWFGQVHVLGWATAAIAAERPLTVRYVARAAAPAAADLDDLPSDIRAVGACLFEALALQPLSGPLDASISRLGPAERKRLPPLLRAVLRKAITSDGAGGYRSIVELGQDLGRFLEGQAPLAWQPGAFERGAIVVRRHRIALGIAALALLAMAGAAWLAFGQRVQEYMAWGQPIASESFVDESWRSRWSVPEQQGFELRDGHLISVGELAARAVYRTRLSLPVAIEYTGEILAGATPGDLSVTWLESDEEVRDPAELITRQDARQYLIQAGAYENSYCAIFRNPGYQRVAYNSRHLKIATPHRFRVEIDQERIAMRIDGELVTEYRDRFPTTAGYLGLYGFFAGKSFSDVSIFQGHIPEQVSPLAVGDGIYQIGRYAEAAVAYARIASSHRGRPVAEEAIFRKGLCERRLGRNDLAVATWTTLSDPLLRQRVDTFRIEDHFNNQEIDDLVALFEDQYADRPAMRDELRRQWQDFMRRVWPDARFSQPAAVIDRLLRLRDRLFPDDANSQFVAAHEMIGIGRAAEVLQRYPDDRLASVIARLTLGRSDEVLALPWLQRDMLPTALTMAGEYSRMVELSGVPAQVRNQALCKLGRANEALLRFGRYPALLYLGRAAELTSQELSPDLAANALLVQGRFAEAADMPGLPGSGRDPRALLLLGRLAEAEQALHSQRAPLTRTLGIRLMAHVEAGETAQAEQLIRSLLPPRDLRASSGWFGPVVVAPLLERISGVATAPQRALAAGDALRGAFGRRATIMAHAVFDATAPEKALSSLPATVEIPAWSSLADGIRAELAGNPGAAKAAYRAFSELPLHHRLLDEDSLDLDVEWFVAWRLRALKP